MGRSNVPEYWGPDTLKMLALIASRGGVNSNVLADEMGISLATVKRYLTAARRTFGVVTRFSRKNGQPGEFVIEGWGLLDSARLLAMYHPNKWAKSAAGGEDLPAHTRLQPAVPDS